MKFYMPVRVYDEADCVKGHGKELASHGDKALIVTGRHSAKACGALDDVISVLDENGKAYCVFSEVEENPSVETIMKASSFGMEEQADFVIGIGGGSPLDAAKAIAFMMKRKSDQASDLYNASLPTESLDVIAIPTTCGTGSEVTGVSVLTVHDKATKMSIPHRIYPVLALIDGKYLKSAPLSMIANTAVDAFAHMSESYLSTKADLYSKTAALAGMKLWSEVKDILTGERQADDDDYAKLMRASALAGIAIAQTGTSIPHALSYILTYDQKVPHGKACGYFLGKFIALADEKDQKEILQAAGFESCEELSAYLNKALGEIQVPQETLQRAFDNVSASPVRMKSCRFEMDPDKLRIIANL